MPVTPLTRRLLPALLVAGLAPGGRAEARICDRPTPEIVRAVAPSVVHVLTLTVDPYRAGEQIRYGGASGFVLDAAGHVVTSAHAVHGAREMIIATGRGQPIPAEVVGLDAVTDIAILRQSTAPDVILRGPVPTLPPAQLGGAEEVAVGETMLVIGYPVGLGQTVTRGILTARDRVLPLGPLSWTVPMLQTDAAVSRGNSGGPLVDSCGEVVGVISLILTAASDAALAVPIATVREVAAEILEKGRVARPWHGLTGRMVPPIFALFRMPPGFMIETVEPGSAADLAGLRGGRLPVRIGPESYLLGGDIITAVNGRSVAWPGALVEVARTLRIGQRIRVSFLREGEPMEAEAELPERPALAADFLRFRDR